jgi:hypothetical protein
VRGIGVEPGAHVTLHQLRDNGERCATALLDGTEEREH